MKTSSSWLKWAILILVIAVLGASIARAIVARKAKVSQLAQSTETAQSDVIHLSERDVYVVAPRQLDWTIPISGSLVAQRTAIVKAKVAAELLQLHVREGDQVRAGQALGQLDTQEVALRRLQAQQQAASAKAIWTNAEQTLSNNQALVAQGFISRAALDGALANAASTKANYEAAQAAARLAEKAWADTRIVAPLSGQVSQRFVQPGERLNIDARIVEIIDLDSLEWQVPMSPEDVANVRPGAAATFKIEGLNETFQAKIARINPTAAADTRSVMVYLSLPKHPALRQGLFAQGNITVSSREGLAVPAAAVTRSSGRDEVLRIEGDRVVRVPVKMGLRSTQQSGSLNTYAEITEGLKSGDRILANATGTVRESAKVTLPSPPSAQP